MIMKLKMSTTGKKFDKIYLKAIKDIFSNMWSAVKGGMGWSMKEKGKAQFFGGKLQSPPQSLP